jgi:hypothetical protein
MVATLIVFGIILALALIFLPFLHRLMKDEVYLKEPLEKKFEVFISMINQGILGGKGKIEHTETERQVNLFTDDEANKIINLYYSTGHLTVFLKFKWYHKEMEYEKTFYNMSNPSTFEQKDAANEFLEEARIRMEKHMQSALGTPEQTANHTRAGVEMPDDPMSILTDVYKDLSMDQRRAIMGFMYVIGTADGTSENTVINNPMFLNQLRTLGLAWSECKTQLTEKGEDYIYQQLKGIDSGLAAMLMLNAFPLTGDNETGPVEKRVSKFYEAFNRIGYDEKSVDENMQKALMLMDMFGK